MAAKRQTVAVIDYAGGNLASARRAISKAGELSGQNVDVFITRDPEDVRTADRLVLPGQGAFGDCMAGLRENPQLVVALKEAVSSGTPFLGICVGMQILAQEGREDAPTTGLGWIKGVVRKLPCPDLPLPQMGWNDLIIDHDHPLVEGLGANPNVYFVHSYGLCGGEDKECIAHTDYGGSVPALVSRANVAGTQFHTEKSQQVGLKILANFLTWQPQDKIAL